MPPSLLLYDLGNFNFLGLASPIYEIRELYTLLCQKSFAEIIVRNQMLLM